jgi:type I restriction enzyme S subunit
MDELCDVTSSKRIYASELTQSGVPFYRSKEIIEKLGAQGEHSNPLFISEERFQIILRQSGAPIEGDLLLTSRGTLGVPYIVSGTDRFHFADGNLTWFRRFQGLDSQFLKFYLLSPAGKAELERCVIGSSQLAYTIAAIKQILVPLPPLTTQKRIADILSAYDELIENCQRRIKILETMARRFYREWFVQFRFPGHENHPHVTSALGKVPEGWEVKKLGEVAKVLRGRSYRSVDLAEDGGLPFLNLKCLDRDGGFRRSGLKRYIGEYKEGHIARKGDIVMAVTDMTQERRIVARAALVPTLESDFSVFSMDLVKIEPKAFMSKAFLYSLLRFSVFADEVKQHANGANVLHLSPDRITGYQCVFPPNELASRFSEFVAPVIEQMDALENRISNLRRTRDLLLPRLLSGSLIPAAFSND